MFAAADGSPYLLYGTLRRTLPRKLRGQHRAHCRYRRDRHVIRPRSKPLDR